MKVIYPITLDVKKTNIQKKISAFTEEGGTRELVITLVSGNDTIEVTNDYAVSVVGVKPDGTEFANTATVRDGKIHYTLTTQNVAVAGDVDCQIRVFKTGELLYTSKFLLRVESNLSDEESETSSNEWTELITALNRVNALSVVFTGEGAPTTDPQEYPDIQESNFYYDETNGVFYYATAVTTTITWKRIYNKDEVDAALDLKADKSTTYTKTEVDTALSAKANSSDVYTKSETYTKSEVNTALSAKQDTIDSSHKLSADNVDDTTTINKFTNATEKAAWNAKQNALTAGSGIDITNDTISFKRLDASNNLLQETLTGGYMEVSQQSVGYDENVREYLQDSRYDNPLAPKAIVSEYDPPRLSTDYPDRELEIGQIWINTEDTDYNGGTYIMWYKLQNSTNYTYVWLPLADASNVQNKLTTGNGIDISNDEISVDLASTNNIAKFSNGKLIVTPSDIGLSNYIRQALTQSGAQGEYPNPLASKSYVDNLVSGTIHYLVVETLPTEDIDTHTIYLVPKSTSQTNNVYDEYMYINSTWELIGSTEVDLSNYYTKSEVYTKSETVTEINNRSNKVYYAVWRDGEVSTLKSDYANIKVHDLISSDSETDARMLYEVQYVNPYIDQIKIQKITQLRYVSGTPKTTASASDEVYYIDDIVFSDNGNIYRVLTKDLSDVPNISYTYQTYGGSGSYSGGDGIDITNDTISVDLKSGSKLQFDNGELDVDLSSKQDTIDSSHKLSADNVDDTNTTNKFTNATEKSTWNDKQEQVVASTGLTLASDNKTLSVTTPLPTSAQADSGKILSVNSSGNAEWQTKNYEDKTTISTDTTSTTVSLTLADNHEYRYTQDLSSLTLTMPSGDFIASIVFASGSTPTQMTYDSSIKWSGDDVTNGQFVPSASKDYDICLYYNGLNINGIVRGV